MSSDSSGDRPLILVADDDADILALVRYGLADCGYEVVTAVDGEAALELALARRPDVAVLDVHMPQMTGPEVARSLLEVEDGPEPSVIFFSAAAPSEVASELDARFLRKPFQLKQLVETVESVLSSRAAGVV